MAEVQIRDISHTHEAFMDWMLLNPHRTLGEMAAVFGYSQSWVSVVINSDVFQRKFAERRGDVNVLVTETTVSKMQAVADIGLSRLTAIMPTISDPEFIAKTTDRMLERLGYTHKSPQGTAPLVQNNYFIGKDKLASLRGVIINGSAERADVNNPAAEQLAAPAGDTMGQVCSAASDGTTAAPVLRAEEGDQV